MPVIGCLLILILPLIGFGIGTALHSEGVAIAGALIGFCVAVGIGAVSTYALVKARRR